VLFDCSRISSRFSALSFTSHLPNLVDSSPKLVTKLDLSHSPCYIASALLCVSLDVRFVGCLSYSGFRLLAVLHPRFLASLVSRPRIVVNESKGARIRKQISTSVKEKTS